LIAAVIAFAIILLRANTAIGKEVAGDYRGAPKERMNSKYV